MENIYSTAFMLGVIEVMLRPASHLLGLYFPTVETFTSETVDFDFVQGAEGLAPLVLPTVEGEVIREQGKTAKSIKPAYVKPKTPLAPGGALKRQAGETIGGALSPMDRQLARVSSTMADHVARIVRRKEWMASQIMQTGTLTLVGDKYPETVLDFQRHGDLSVALLTTARWGESGVKPLDDLQDWVSLVAQHGGVAVTDVTMDILAWKIFRVDPDVKDQLNYRRDISAQMNTRFHAENGAVYQGSIGSLNFYTYDQRYVDDAGSTQKMIPDYGVMLGGPGSFGVQAHGAIQDDAAGFQALEFFPKSWVPEDPAVRQVMTQSAPVVFAGNPNGTFFATVR